MRRKKLKHVSHGDKIKTRPRLSALAGGQFQKGRTVGAKPVGRTGFTGANPSNKLHVTLEHLLSGERVNPDCREAQRLAARLHITAATCGAHRPIAFHAVGRLIICHRGALHLRRIDRVWFRCHILRPKVGNSKRNLSKVM